MNPWALLGTLVLLAATGLGSCSYGQHLGQQACAAAAGKAIANTKRAQDSRDAAVDTIGTAARAAADAATTETRSNTHAAIERVRTVVVPGPCRDVDPVIVREHDEAQQRIDAKIRSGVRPAGAGASGRGTDH